MSNLALFLIIMSLSALDLAFTFLHMDLCNATELNPLMAWCISVSRPFAALVKMVLTGVAAGGLAHLSEQGSKFGRKALEVSAWLYGLLCLWHLYLAVVYW